MIGIYDLKFIDIVCRSVTKRYVWFNRRTLFLQYLHKNTKILLKLAYRLIITGQSP